MKTGYSLTQVQNQKLTMTPELQQSIHILQLSSYELSQYLQEQALENPLLDIESFTSSSLKTGKSSQLSGSISDPLWKAKAKEETLEQCLLSQLRIAGVPDDVYKTAAYLAGNLDDRGYLPLSISEVSTFLNKPKEVVEVALSCLQSLEPPGIGARDLQECLLLQISRDPAAPHGTFEVVSQNMQQLAQMKLDKIAQQLGATLMQVKEIVTYIRNLNPRPGMAFSWIEESYMIPDATIYKEQGNIVIQMNAGAIPKTSVNTDYYSHIQQAGCQDAVSFIKEKWKTADWVVRSLEQRKMTLYRVIRAIFEEQLAFLEIGVRGIKPLTLKMISEKLDLHESTISRTVQNKYIRTPYGVLELKYFFSSGLQSDEGELTSIKTIKIRIKELISQEQKKQPYSDQKVVEILTEEGIRISRRTVTKYREEMHILSSALRKNIL
ncbi:RNA polymerase factor sigma-54 [Paenibacillus alginolyticus]|uniref:RNA polymerase factor sigma-54 n=1 Tax=Paenibacillus alginolyticus TaxID=59839 RepID=A0ABT4GKW4_9BACL|nr:RNA polymerase factor sigma-54 [Paenibacillus alginolyticus]MCY9696841.1 RNA polymerase factor sigma-54 [Paenibacillus alginolyticus]MEC0147645.1 RNA polymerase factor sigma-54 [Paenibacillus alginolyticus]